MLLQAFLNLQRIVRLIRVAAKYGASPLLRWLLRLPASGPSAGVPDCGVRSRRWASPI